MKLIQRPRRLRQNPITRQMIRETLVHTDQLIQPYFVVDKPQTVEEISGFSDVFRRGIDTLSKEIEADLECGLARFMLFAEATSKTKDAAESTSPESLMPRTLRALRSRFGKEALLFTDVCLCSYTEDGHCGLLHEETIQNDASLEVLGKMAAVHAEAGADFVCPSDMMDGRVGVIRGFLDEAGFSDTGILAYTAKYASHYYGPFRNALDSAPRSGDRSTYQMDFRNSREALRELTLDIDEGADIVMVKPALAYLDIIQRFADKCSVPVAAYSVSGEYEMVKRMAAAGLADEKLLFQENLTAIRRAGADLIVTYVASRAAREDWWSR